MIPGGDVRKIVYMYPPLNKSGHWAYIRDKNKQKPCGTLLKTATGPVPPPVLREKCRFSDPGELCHFQRYSDETSLD